MVKITQKICFILMLGSLGSCASTTNNLKSPESSSKDQRAEDGFASESVREAYLRLKKVDYTAQDRKKDEEESAKVAKKKSKSMIDGAGNS